MFTIGLNFKFKKEVCQKYIRNVQECHKNVTTRVRSMVGKVDSFHVKVGLDQGPALNPILFNIVFSVVSKNVRVEPLGCMLYANDIVLMTNSRRQLEMQLK